VRVLVADDSEVVRERVVDLLRELGARVTQARDANEVLERLQTGRADALILDVVMPGGGAMRVLEELAAQEHRPLVIVFTSYADPEHREAFLAAGADHFLDKSGDMDELLRILQDHEV
jgi:CheY-like chemotaxis protein